MCPAVPRQAWGKAMRTGAALAVLCSCGTAFFTSPASAQSNNVRITGLTDVTFGSLTGFSDVVSAQSVCAFSNTATKGYRVTATGTGASGAFTLASGVDTLAYEVQWNGSSGQTSGTALTPNVPRTGLISSATQQQCNSGPATSASLIVLVRGTTLTSATAGSYSGTLSITLGPE